MSDTRRRRKQSGGSDDLSDSYDELNATKETQSSERTDGHHDSEYDTAGSDAEGDSEAGSQDGERRESGDGQEEDKPRRKLDDDEDRRNPQYIPKRGTFYEHDDRTTEETGESTAEPAPERETKEKKVWKDKEDRWNHDKYNDGEQAPKSHEELVAVYGYDIRNEEGPPRARRRRRYGRGPNKYTRNWEDEDAYGKTAASVTGGKNPGRRINKTGEEFPALGTAGTASIADKDSAADPVDEPVISSAWYTNKNKSQTKQQNFPPLHSQQDNHKPKSASAIGTHTNENRAPNEPTNPAWKREPKFVTRNASPNRNAEATNPKSSPREPKKRQVQESVSLAASKTRGRGFKTGGNNNNNLLANKTLDSSRPKGRGAGLLSNEPRRNNASHHDDERQSLPAGETKQPSINDGSYHHNARQNSKNFYAQASHAQQKSNVVPPRMLQQQQQQQQHHHHQQQPQQQHQQQQQQPPQVNPQQPDVAGNRPKRYSSLRQRPAIPEGPGQQQQQQQQQQAPYPSQHSQHGFYPPQAGNSHGVVLESQGFPQGHYEQTAPVGNPPVGAPPLTAQPVIPLAPGGQAAGYAPPPFLVPPPQFISPQAAPPSIINYVPTPAGPAFPPNFQGYQGYNPAVQPQVPPPPPPELFQPQGCTYYSPAQQQQQQGAPLRRPKAAIPILPPPVDTSNAQYHQISRGRGRTPQQQGHAGILGNVPAMQQNRENEMDDRAAVSTIEDEAKTELFENAQYEQQQPPSPLPCLPVELNEIEPTEPIEPVQVEPVQIEPVQVEPVQIEPVQVEPVQVEPVQIKPVQLEPSPVEPVEPIASVEPVELISSVDPVEPIALKGTDGLDKLIDSVDPVDPVEAVEAVQTEPLPVEPVHVDSVTETLTEVSTGTTEKQFDINTESKELPHLERLTIENIEETTTTDSKTVEIDASIGDTEITEKKPVVSENPVVEEAAA